MSYKSITQSSKNLKINDFSKTLILCDWRAINLFIHNFELGEAGGKEFENLELILTTNRLGIPTQISDIIDDFVCDMLQPMVVVPESVFGKSVCREVAKGRNQEALEEFTQILRQIEDEWEEYAMLKLHLYLML